MQHTDAAQPITTLPRHNRPMIVLSHALLALVFVPIAGLIGAEASPSMGAVSVIALSLVMLASAVRRWRARVDLFADHLAYGRGARMTRVPFSAVERVDVMLYDARTTFLPDALATLRVEAKGAAPVVVENRKLVLLAPVVDALVSSLADRAGAEMSRGEQVRFADRPRFPWLMVSGLGFLGLCGLAAAIAGFANGAGFGDMIRGLRGAVFFGALFGGLALPAVRSWWGARRSRGVALSSQGLRPLADHELAARASRIADPFRGAGGEVAGWIPWSAVRGVERDNFGLRVHLHSRPDPVVLSAATPNLVVLHELVQRYAPQVRAPTSWVSGVRVPDEAERAPETVDAAAARAEEARRGASRP